MSLKEHRVQSTIFRIETPPPPGLCRSQTLRVSSSSFSWTTGMSFQTSLSPASHLNRGSASGCSLTCQIVNLAKVVPIPANTLQPHDMLCFSKLITSIIYESPWGFQLPGNSAVRSLGCQASGHVFGLTTHPLSTTPHPCQCCWPNAFG